MANDLWQLVKARDLVSRAELHDEDIDEAFRSVCRDYMSMARLELEREVSREN